MTKQNLAPPRPHRLAKILTPIISGAVLLVGFGVYAGLTNTFTPQWFADQITVANFQPNETLEQIVERSGMNQRGKFMFYVTEPQVEGREDFNFHCAELLNELSNVLGCYDGRTYLFDVTDPRIEGVENVTAAHEMLHSAYDRLGVLERIEVDNLIKRQLADTTDPDILELVELYSQTEPGQEINELHSIFGTEARDLSPELERYYSKYFDDRLKVVEQNEKYQAVFKEMEQRAEELEQKTTVLGEEIDSLTAEYESAAAQLSGDIDSFNARAAVAGGFASESVFYSQRSGLVSRQSQLEAQLSVINAKIEEYNGYVEELQAIGRDAERLQSNLDSTSFEELE
jgi:uncharacterized protein YukE